MTQLASTNAPTGVIYLLVTETDKATGKVIAEYPMTYSDTDGDYGDTFDKASRSRLSAGEPVAYINRISTTTFRCMVTAARKGATA